MRLPFPLRCPPSFAMSGWSLVPNRSSFWGRFGAWKGPWSRPTPRKSLLPEPKGKAFPRPAYLEEDKEPCDPAPRGDCGGVGVESLDGVSTRAGGESSGDEIDCTMAAPSSREELQTSGGMLAAAGHGSTNEINGDVLGKVVLNSKWEEDDPRNWWNKLVAEDVEAVSNYRKSLISDNISLEGLESLIKKWILEKKTVAEAEQHGWGDSEPTRPMWVGIYQEPSQDTAALYATGFPITDESLSKFILQGTPQATLRGCTFENFDVKFGNWRSFFVGVKGSVCGAEEHVFWPNWLYHNARRRMNCRGWEDLGEFLADPTEERILSHLENTRRYQENRGYHKGWSYYRLRDRWGQENLKRYGIDV